MDLLRSCYTTRMRVFADSEETIQIRWYFTSESAKFFPSAHKFWSRNWTDRDSPPSPLGEVKGATRSYYNGKNVWGYRGQCYVGPLSAFQSGLTHPLPSPAPFPLCCAVPLVTVGHIRSASMFTTPEVFFPLSVGQNRSSEVFTTPEVFFPLSVGQNRSSEVFTTPEVFFPLSVGQTRSSEIDTLTGDILHLAVGQTRSSEVLFTPKVSFAESVGQNRASEVLFTPKVSFAESVGQNRASEVLFTPEVSFAESVGQNRSATLTGSTPVGPGATCATAGALALSTPYTGNISSGSPPPDQWFKIAVGTGSYKWLLTVNSGFFLGSTGSQGVCGSQTPVSPPPANVCNSFSGVTGGWVYVKISGPIMGTTNYTLEVRSGTCPW